MQVRSLFGGCPAALGEGKMAITHNPNFEQTATPRQVLVASPHLSGTAYDRKVALVVGYGRNGFRGIEVNKVFRESLLAARKSMQEKTPNRLSPARQFQLGVINWAPGELEEELRTGVWMTTSTTFAKVLASRDGLWVDLVRRIGHSVLRDSLGIKRFPRGVSVN
jgi:putative AlgH/UPF0301 family transcriptional regulator